MRELIKIINQGTDLMADSRSVAKLFGVQHESLRKLIEDHSDQISQLGHLRFEIGDGVKRPQGGGKQEKFAFLNFDQIAFLLTVSKPSEATKDFRLRLILAFRTAREKLRPIDRALLTVPEKWNRTFGEDFYVALLKIYGDTFKSMAETPPWVGKWTNKFIYKALYDGLPQELKQRRSVHLDGSENAWLKLHQFIETHAKKNLEVHLIKVTALLQASRSQEHFLELFAGAFGGRHQLLFGGNDFS